MKIRTNFVSNSSSCSFICLYLVNKDLNLEEDEIEIFQQDSELKHFIYKNIANLMEELTDYTNCLNELNEMFPKVREYTEKIKELMEEKLLTKDMIYIAGDENTSVENIIIRDKNTKDRINAELFHTKMFEYY